METPKQPEGQYELFAVPSGETVEVGKDKNLEVDGRETLGHPAVADLVKYQEVRDASPDAVALQEALEDRDEAEKARKIDDLVDKRGLSYARARDIVEGNSTTSARKHKDLLQQQEDRHRQAQAETNRRGADQFRRENNIRRRLALKDDPAMLVDEIAQARARAEKLNKVRQQKGVII